MNIAHHFLLGRYKEGNTLIHRLDPRVKLIFIVIISLSLFFIDNLYAFFIPFGMLFLVTVIARIKISGLIRGILPIIWLVMITFVLHAFIPPANLEYGVNISLRIILLFGWACVLTVTTSAVNLGKSIAWFTRPFTFLGAKPDSVALTFSMSLRFFPLILEEAESIINAHKLRNDELNIKQKLSSFITVFFIRVLKKADLVENTLINRDLNPGEGKSMWRMERKIGFREITIFLIGLGYLGVIIIFF
ncbi:MAG: energy-coupling factor transporter transmembrane component T family protein [Elusimicrobiota bacterium]